MECGRRLLPAVQPNEVICEIEGPDGAVIFPGRAIDPNPRKSPPPGAMFWWSWLLPACAQNRPRGNLPIQSGSRLRPPDHVAGERGAREERVACLASTIRNDTVFVTPNLMVKIRRGGLPRHFRHGIGGAVRSAGLVGNGSHPHRSVLR